MGHPQPPTPIQTDNSTAEGVINKKVQPKRTKAMDMRFHWLRDRETLKQFRFYWRPGKLSSFEVVDEIEAVRKLGMDIQGYSEINKPWNKENKVEFDMMMDILFDQSRTPLADLIMICGTSQEGTC